MDWQQFAALAIVAAAAGFFLRGRLRRRRFSFERDTPCGCAARPGLAQRNSVIFHARKGERPEVVLKMR